MIFPSTLIVSRDSFSLWTWARVQTARSTAYFNGCPYLCLKNYYITIYDCVEHFYNLSALAGCWPSVSIRRIIYKFSNVCPFDYTVVAVSGKVVNSQTGLTTPVGWLLLLQLTVLSRSALVVQWKFLVAFSCCYVAFWIFFVGVRAFVIGLSQISSFSLGTIVLTMSTSGLVDFQEINICWSCYFLHWISIPNLEPMKCTCYRLYSFGHVIH